MVKEKTLETVQTNILIISDTQNFDSFNPNHPGAFRHFPKIDLVLHCGNLTEYGALPEYGRAIEMLGSIQAEKKLVIAGNRDTTLDKGWVERHRRHEHIAYPETFQEARDTWKSTNAESKGIEYLEEGHHPITLPEIGAKFNVYASPYKPQSNPYGFQYDRHVDRYSKSENPMGAFPDVDIIITHGPPRGIMDKLTPAQTRAERPGQPPAQAPGQPPAPGNNVGCANLLEAVQRARPRLHCFGHVREGNGALVAAWRPRHHGSRSNDFPRNPREPVFDNIRKLPRIYPEPVECKMEFGHETLMVNACIMNADGQAVKKPWLVSIDLPTQAAWRERMSAKEKRILFPCCAQSETKP